MTWPLDQKALHRRQPRPVNGSRLRPHRHSKGEINPKVHRSHLTGVGGRGYKPQREWLTDLFFPERHSTATGTPRWFQC